MLFVKGWEKKSPLNQPTSISKFYYVGLFFSNVITQHSFILWNAFILNKKLYLHHCAVNNIDTVNQLLDDGVKLFTHEVFLEKHSILIPQEEFDLVIKSISKTLSSIAQTVQTDTKPLKIMAHFHKHVFDKKNKRNVFIRNQFEDIYIPLCI